MKYFRLLLCIVCILFFFACGQKEEAAVSEPKKADMMSEEMTEEAKSMGEEMAQEATDMSKEMTDEVADMD